MHLSRKPLILRAIILEDLLCMKSFLCTHHSFVWILLGIRAPMFLSTKCRTGTQSWRKYPYLHLWKDGTAFLYKLWTAWLTQSLQPMPSVPIKWKSHYHVAESMVTSIGKKVALI